VKIRKCVQALSNAEREELEKKMTGNSEDLIFKSITSNEKISVFSPDMHTKDKLSGRGVLLLANA